MFRLLAIANLLVICLAFEIAPIIENGLVYSDISTAPFVKIGDGYYYIETATTKNWFGAYENCRLIGADLISFDTIEEWNAVNDYIKEMDNTVRIYYTSGTDLAKTGEHVWFSTGQQITANVWANGEPNNKDDIEHCDQFLKGQGLNDADCNIRRHYICEAPMPKTASFIIW